MYSNPLLCCFSGFSFSTVLTKAGEGSFPTSTREAGKAEAGGGGRLIVPGVSFLLCL